MPRRNAPLTETGRLRLARVIVEEGWPVREIVTASIRGCDEATGRLGAAIGWFWMLRWSAWP